VRLGIEPPATDGFRAESAYWSLHQHVTVCLRCSGEVILQPVFARVRHQPVVEPDLCPAGKRLMTILCRVLAPSVPSV